jgi:hypothetical protein
VDADSDDVNAKLAEVAVTEPVGPEVIVVFGLVASTVHMREAGEASVLPSPSVARTSNV